MTKEAYRAGAIDAQLEIMNHTLGEIRKSLSEMIEWQREVDARLASGVERFRQMDRNTGCIEELKESDRKWGVAAMIGSAVAGAIAVLKQ